MNPRTMLFGLVLLIAPTVAWGQINTLTIPDEVDVGRKIVATCNCVIPDGGKLSIIWQLSPGLEGEQADNRMFLWGLPGNHSVRAVVIPLRTITIPKSGQTPAQQFDVIAGPILNLDARFKIMGEVEPEPDPDPDPEPDPSPDDAPFPSNGFAVMILREASETGLLPREQKAIFTSSQVIRFCKENCVNVAPGDPFFRVWDDDYTDTQLQRAPAALATAFRDVKRQANGRLPWIAIADGKGGGFSGPLPGNVADTMELLNRFRPRRVSKTVAPKFDVLKKWKLSNG